MVCTLDSKTFEHGHRMICDGFPSFVDFGGGDWSDSNFLAPTVLTRKGLVWKKMSNLFGP